MKIDVHHHVAPDFWIALPGGTVDERRVFDDWSPARAIEEMDRDGVATAYASLTVAGHRFADPAVARRLARRCNEYMAQLRVEHPGRFAFFALLPMPDIDGSLAEIAYAYDQLKADGIGLMTSYGDWWLGDARFDPVFEELNRRKAVVFTHPTSNAACTHRQEWLGPAPIEYGTDTTRAIAEYVLRGASQRYPAVRVIFSHAGGTMPYLVQRFINQGNGRFKEALPHGFLAEAQKLYYDTAQVPARGTMLALKEVVPETNILFGSDYPYRTCGWTAELLTSGKAFDARGLDAVFHENAARLLR
ncbi:MAG TPA: amidohydrolase family protein [Candidatus Lustribacter sp.]|jgi:predicted TIM-barrel fold metal-dependent hydrolase|nr:amidohydrolase family protein [Candidatus Lustribacter sp.]